MDLDDIYNYLIDYGIATKEQMELITGVYGYSEDVFNDIIYYKTAYHDIEQLLECEDYETYKQYYGNNDED